MIDRPAAEIIDPVVGKALGFASTILAKAKILATINKIAGASASVVSGVIKAAAASLVDLSQWAVANIIRHAGDMLRYGSNGAAIVAAKWAKQGGKRLDDLSTIGRSILRKGLSKTQLDDIMQGMGEVQKASFLRHFAENPNIMKILRSDEVLIGKFASTIKRGVWKEADFPAKVGPKRVARYIEQKPQLFDDLIDGVPNPDYVLRIVPAQKITTHGVAALKRGSQNTFAPWSGFGKQHIDDIHVNGVYARHGPGAPPETSYFPTGNTIESFAKLLADRNLYTS